MMQPTTHHVGFVPAAASTALAAPGAVMDARINGIDTKGDAYRAVPQRERQDQSKRLYDCLRALERLHGLDGATAREIQAAYEEQFSRRIDSSTVAARLHAMREAGEIYQGKQPRKCSITGKMVMVNFTTPQQKELL